MRSAAVRDGGWRHVPLPHSVIDPTDADGIRAAHTRPTSPDVRLRLAVFEQALHELRRYPADTPLGAAARAWFASDEQTWPCAFAALCDTFGLDPAAVRRRVLGGEHARGRIVLLPIGRRAAAR
jgi:hypothetical protein